MQQKWKSAPALVLVDIQQGFDDIPHWGGERNNPLAETNAAQLLAFWRKRQWPVFHIRHDSVEPQSPLRPGQPGNDFKPGFQPAAGEPLITKNVNSAFIGTDLKERLDRQGIRHLVIAGLTTQHCVSTTTRMAGNFGYDAVVVSDATAAFAVKGLDGKTIPAQLIHEVSLATLNGEFAEVVATAEVLSAASSGNI